MKRVLGVFLLSLMVFCSSGCETVRLGGRGKLGPVRGSGDIVLDVPAQEDEDQ